MLNTHPSKGPLKKMLSNEAKTGKLLQCTVSDQIVKMYLSKAYNLKSDNATHPNKLRDKITYRS